MMPKPNSVLVDRRTFCAIENVVREHHQSIPYIDDDTAMAGFNNVLVFGGWKYENPIILIAGES